MKGFSLFELIIAIAIAMIMTTLVSINLFGYRGQQDLNLSVQEITTILRSARDKSITQESGAQWGVHFQNSVSGDSFYDLFSGPNYASGTLSARATLRNSIQFQEPASGNSKDVTFSLLTGLPDASSTIIISLKNDISDFKIITINSNGQIQY